MNAAKLVSAILSYPVIGFFEIIFLSTIEKIEMLNLIVIISLHSIAPFLAPLIYGLFYIKGDFFIDDRRHRLPMFIPGILSYFLAYIFSKNIGLKYIPLLEIISTISTIILFIITFKWKISIHMASLTIPLIFFPLIGFQYTIFLSPLLLVLAWARIKMKAHDFKQIVGGVIEGIVAVFLVIFCQIFSS